MKLFQKLLVAGTAVSLITPFAAQASDLVNLEEMNNYVRSGSKSKRFDSKTFVSEGMATLEGHGDGLAPLVGSTKAGFGHSLRA